MNAAMMETAMANIRDPEFMNRFMEERRVREEERAAFAASETFLKMVSTFKANAADLSVDSEDIAYFPERVREQMGWLFASAADLKAFISEFSNPDPTAETPVSTDDECPFDNSSFVKHGLSVFVMSGQGTIVRVYNR